MHEILGFEACTQNFFMIEGFEVFLTVDSTFLLGEGEATDAFIIGGGAASAEGREVGLSVFVLKVEVYS